MPIIYCPVDTLTDGGEATGSCYQLEKLLDCFPSSFYFSSFRNWIEKKNIVNTEVLDYIQYGGWGETTGSCYQLDKLLQCFSLFILFQFLYELKKI